MNSSSVELQNAKGRQNKTAAVLGGGINSLLAALLLNEKSWKVSIFHELDFPLVLLPGFLNSLRNIFPAVTDRLLASKPALFTPNSLMADKFDVAPGSGNARDQSQIICCRSTVLRKILMDEVVKIKQIEIVTAIPDEAISNNFEIILDSRRNDSPNLAPNEVVIGNKKCALVKYYQIQPGDHVKFRLFSKPELQGGVYPQDDNWCAIVFILDQQNNQNSNSELLFETILTKHKDLKLLSELNILKSHPARIVNNLVNSCRYNQSARKILIGNAFVSSNPIYGHSLAFTYRHLNQIIEKLPDGKADEPLNYNKLKMQIKIEEFKIIFSWKSRVSSDSQANRLSILAKKYFYYFINPLAENDMWLYRKLLHYYLLQSSYLFLLNPYYHFKAMLYRLHTSYIPLNFIFKKPSEK